MPIHTYANWNRRETDQEEQVEPYRKYIFICEGANTETRYFRHLIDIKKQLGIHSRIDIRLWEKTGEDKNLSFPKNLAKFAEEQKNIEENGFYRQFDKMVIVFDGDVFEEKVSGYKELVESIEEHDIAAVTNPGFELFLILHVKGSVNKYIKGNEAEFLKRIDNKYKHAYDILHELTGMNAKKNPQIGKMADDILIAIEQEKMINQNIHDIHGRVTSNIGMVIERIINDEPEI